MRTDKHIFKVWPRFVAARESIENYRPDVPEINQDDNDFRRIYDGIELLQQGKEIITYLSSARVPMPKTAKAYLERCDIYQETGRLPRTI